MLSMVFLVATCTLAAALPKPDIIVVDPEPARSDFIAYGQGDTFVDSALKSKMGDEGPGESRAQVLGLLAGEGTFGSKSETVLDLPQGAGTSVAGEKSSGSQVISQEIGSKMALFEKDLYNKLQWMKMCEDDLRRFCFPRSHWQSGKAQLFNIEQSINTTIHGPRSRTCKRCNTVYRVDNKGCAVNLETCVHHWAKVSRSVNPYYHCCKRPINSPPCATAPQHVTGEIDQFNLTGFINTSLNQSLTAKAIYAIDCEMLYTKTGMDVAAISIVDSECELVYETLILPESPIVDYNTEHSGLTMQQFRHVSTRLADVHAKLLTLFGSRTILVGHGLDHDLLRLKVIHDHIIDTSVLFPHPKRFPIRNSVSYLVSKYGMQFTSCSGLKCQNDAKAAMYLVRNWR